MGLAIFVFVVHRSIFQIINAAPVSRMLASCSGVPRVTAATLRRGGRALAARARAHMSLTVSGLRNIDGCRIDTQPGAAQHRYKC